MKKLLIILLTTLTLFAQNDEKLVEANLVSEINSIQPGSTFWLGINLKMENEWHTYWKNAGDAGMATYINWNLPEGFTAGEIVWPYPMKIYMSGLANFGYEGETTLLVKLTAPQNYADETVTIKAHVEWLVCKIECLPGNANLEIALPVKNTLPEVNEAALEKFADARFNIPLNESSWKIESVKSENEVIIKVTPAEYDYELTDLYFFPSKNGIYQNAPDQKFELRNGSYYLTVLLENFRAEEPESLDGVLVTSQGWRGENSEKALNVNVEFQDQFEVNEESNITVLAAIFFAFIGGLILNLMPCVLPVLSIKILGFVNHKNQSRSASFVSGLWFTLGVLISFWILTTLLLILREGGEALGWGFQLQSPIFIFLISVFLFLFALNLFGVFEFGTSLTTLENKIDTQNGKFSNFLSGVTAAIVATPCTAPFMGTALGFALTQSALVNVLIFSSLGFGMAFPYLLLSAFPKWMKIIPKPGEWMIKLKQFMGFLLAATVIWLIWVYGLQKGSDGVILLLISLLLSSIAAWVYGNWGMIYIKKTKRVTAQIISLLIIAFALYFGISNSADAKTVGANTAINSSYIDWQKYSQTKVDSLLNEGKPLFIDFTAAWCLSCQVNERVALNNQEVADKFEELGITAFKGDWTNKDDEITRALASFGRNSVPLYILYDKESKVPIKLPEILTKSIVLDALNNLNIKGE
ncbi:MAG: thioredoxin family protein [Melioribacteraceae bacterium]|nr:thioredoxin family protein [Melioribacteraceae bacterium]